MSRVAAHCALVREALSAGADGEQTPLGAEAVARHLRSCQVCRRYAASLASAGERLVDPRRQLPDMPAAQRIRTVLLALRPSRWSLAGRWGVPAAAAAFALPALALGVFGHVHIDPSHLGTPCTHMLHWFPAHSVRETHR